MNFSRSLKTSSQLIQPVGNKVLCGHRKVGGGQMWQRLVVKKRDQLESNPCLPSAHRHGACWSNEERQTLLRDGQLSRDYMGHAPAYWQLVCGWNHEMFHRKISFSVRKHCHPVEDFSERNVLKGRRP